MDIGSMPVRDFAKRTGGALMIRTDEDDVVVTCPLPGSARIPGEDVETFITLLRLARDEVFRRQS